MRDPLFEAIVAAPEDDAPRLVWADREGGERGELVVIQCMLARRGDPPLARSDRVRLVARERELLRAHGQEWSPLRAAGLAKASAFVRGFVEGADVLIDVLAESADAIFAGAPLLRRLVLHERADDPPAQHPTRADHDAAWAASAALLERALARLPAGRIRAISTRPVHRWADRGWTPLSYSDARARILASSAALRSSLRDLELVGESISSEAIEPLRRLEALERLVVSAAWSGDGWLALVRALPRLRHLSATDLGGGSLHGAALDELLGAPELARLRGLDLRSSHLDDADLVRVAATPSLSSLSRLVLGFAGASMATRAGIEAIARSPHLANLSELEVSMVDDAALALLAGAPFAPRLRVLNLALGRLSSASVPTLLGAFPSLETVDVLGTKLGAEGIAALRAEIPTVVC